MAVSDYSSSPNHPINTATCAFLFPFYYVFIYFFSSKTRDVMLHFLNSKRGQWSQNDILIYFFKSLYYFSHHFEPSWCHNQINSSFGIPIQANAQINVYTCSICSQYQIISWAQLCTHKHRHSSVSIPCSYKEK